MKERLARPAALVLGVVAVTVLHRALPTDTHASHGWHLAAERLYYIPILLAAAWLSVPATASALSARAGHVALHA